ncbi:(2Fe-2S)-binding protein [Candidatus Thiodictyon syntrophicum]|jgi:carbon-monoxide dehydrogenase small subunit|uniref:Ferredoxin n=1 Tax=Candidatus Thiodictyon syntrophicum TaxID=1166950 RepID=A0A2K8UI60_9GAMM|nr:(2Fe-2S)-binding protein [Candidatus Thiodictyon syntrophicum]AUB85225.1 ferredoxin [Candidatus Thiodictyon syntrophicum]
MRLRLTVNGETRELEVAPDRRAVDLLREDLGLTGVKEGCGVGECGACTILVDGATRLSCLLLAAQLAGREVTTIEGLAPAGQLHLVQQAFIDCGAVQCGFCSPGMILAVVELLRRDPAPSRALILEGLSGNLCRCTGYHMIIDAVEAAARVLRAEAPS